MTIRVFLAFDISEEIKKNLGVLIETLRSQAKEVKWVDPQNFHGTVKFYGEVDEEKSLPQIEKNIQEKAAGLKPVTLTCQGIGAFPKWESPRVLWAGLVGEVSSLIQLQKELGADYEGLHITIARAKSKPAFTSWMRPLAAMSARVFGEMRIDHLTLYKSELTKGGPIYTSLKEFPFLNQHQ